MYRIAGVGCGVALALGAVGCTEQSPARSAAPVRLPASGRAYRALDREQRTAVAASCRSQLAHGQSGVAADELRSVDPVALREQLDAAYLVIAEQRRPVADVCRRVIAFVTPGMRISFDGAKDDHHGSFSIETDSGRRLRLSGHVTPAPAGAYVVARRDVGPAVVRRGRIRADGRFALPPVGLRKVADNTFTVTVHAAPHAPRKALFTAICLDCLSGGPPPATAQPSP